MSVRIITGHVLDVLRTIPSESIHMCCTSPPYYGLRDYGIEPQVWGGDAAACEHEWGEAGRSSQRQRNGADGGLHEGRATDKLADNVTLHPSTGAFCWHCSAWRGSLGLEPTLDLYLDHMVEVFREVRRVLRKDGTVWLNIGDSYASQGGERRYGSHDGATGSAAQPGPRIGFGFKAKDLMLIPARLAIRLQDDGWWVRSDIAWCKRAPMPESVTDRPTVAWEHVFLLTKAAKYFYDAEAVKEEAEKGAAGSFFDRGKTADHQLGRASHKERDENGKRNMRNWWSLGPEPFPEAHFATFPTEIPRRAILAGTSARGVCPQCAAPWARVTKRIDKGWDGSKYGERVVDASGGAKDGGTARSTLGSANGKLTGETETIGWRPTCECAAGNSVPATVLDPFLGSGTTALVADRLGRDCIGIELSPEYAAIAERRISGDSPLFAQIAAE